MSQHNVQKERWCDRCGVYHMMTANELKEHTGGKRKPVKA